MNRTDGFPIADIDVGLLHDPKVIALARSIRDQRTTAEYVALYLALVLQSWAAGDRVALEEALPAWWLGDVDAVRAALTSVGLLDAESRVPLQAWEGWYLPAFDRREKRRQSGAEGGRRSWSSRRDKRRFGDASATPNPSDRPADRPTVRSGRPSSDLASAAAPSAERAAAMQLVRDAKPCGTCGQPFQILDERKVSQVGGTYIEAHRVCPAVTAA